MGPTSAGEYAVNQTPLPESSAQKPKKSFKNKVVHFVKKYWYIVAFAITIISALITWQVLAAQNAAAWQRAEDHFQKADYASAEAILVNMPVPGDAEQLRVYSQTMLATNHTEKALEGYTKLYEMNNDASTYLIIANIHNQQEEYKQAIEIYRSIIADNNGNVQAYVNLATVYRIQGNKDEAALVAAQAVEANPNNVILLELRVSMLLENKDTNEYREAVDALRAANPEDPLLIALED